MKTNRRLRSWLATQTWCALIGLGLLGLAEVWMLTRFLSDWTRQSNALCVQLHPVAPISPHLALP